MCQAESAAPAPLHYTNPRGKVAAQLESVVGAWLGQASAASRPALRYTPVRRCELSDTRRLTILDLINTEFTVISGRPIPLGVTMTRSGLNFAVFSRNASAASLVLYAPRQHAPVLELALDPEVNRTGDVWHIAIDGLDVGVRYGWRMDRGPIARDRFHRFDSETVLVDPYSRALTGGSRWGEHHQREGDEDAEGGARRSLFVGNGFDWEHVRRPKIPLEDKIIYETHVRGLTVHPSSGSRAPGSYRGFVEKIPYLKDLGVTTVELLPVYEFNENEISRSNPLTGEPLRNYWGYSPIGFFAPKAAYASGGFDGGQVAELMEMVRELHRAGIEVILDVVFNHTGEGDGFGNGDVYSLRGLDNSVYYMLDPKTGEDRNYTGCGNTLNCNHPVVRDLILDALRYWVAEMKVDGFRFDLASVLGRGTDGEVLANPPLLERIANDPVLADVTLIAEAWDAAGLYQVGRFPSWGRWAEWNGRYRDEVRRFLRGEPGWTGALATRLAGSADLYETSGRDPCHSINYVTCHDGFTLADLVAYDRKHNIANGEDNRDGMSENLSWNCGVEGPTTDPEILELRRRQVRNFVTILLVSQGTPMLLGGDELGRSQGGNNNAYCQDNETSWYDWNGLETHADLHRFVRTLIAFRKAHPVLRRRTFLTGRGTLEHPIPDVRWHGQRLNHPDWGRRSRMLAMHLAGAHAPEPDADVYVAINGSDATRLFELPPPPTGCEWMRVVDTARGSPEDAFVAGSEPTVDDASLLRVEHHSCVVLCSRVR